MQQVFADASSLILLEKAGLFELLLNTYSLVIPESIYKEITRCDYPGADVFTTACNQQKLRVSFQAGLNPSGRFSGLKALGAGEKDVIGLFLDLQTGFILLDDGRAARWCDASHLPFINSLLVPKIFWFAGLMDQDTFSRKTEDLCRIGWYSKKIRQTASALSRQELSLFLPVPS